MYASILFSSESRCFSQSFEVPTFRMIVDGKQYIKAIYLVWSLLYFYTFTVL